MLFFFNNTPPTEIYTLSLHDALPIYDDAFVRHRRDIGSAGGAGAHHDCNLRDRSEEHTSELQSLRHLVCRLLLEKKKTRTGVCITGTSFTYPSTERVASMAFGTRRLL